MTPRRDARCVAARSHVDGAGHSPAMRLIVLAAIAAALGGCTLFRAADTPCDTGADCAVGLVCADGFCASPDVRGGEGEGAPGEGEGAPGEGEGAPGEGEGAPGEGEGAPGEGEGA